MAGKGNSSCHNVYSVSCPLLAAILILGCSSKPADPGADGWPSRADEIRAAIERSGGILICDGDGQPVEIDFLASRASADPAAWQAVLSCPTLEVLRIRAGQIAVQDLLEVCALSRLRQLHLHDAAAGDRLIEHLAERLPNLQRISLRNTHQLTDQGVGKLAALTSLTHLALIDQQVTGDVTKDLATLLHLSMLDLRMCHNIRADDLAALAAAPSLKELKLGGYAVDDSLLSAVAGLPHLRSLTIEDAPVGNEGLVQLAAGPSAARIENLAFARCSGLTDKVCEHLQSFPRLRCLVLRDVPVTGRFLRQLPTRTQLQRLSLSQTFLTADALDALMLCSDLQRLDLSGTLLSLQMTQKLARLPGLEYLDLSQCGLTDEVFAPLVALQRLKTLVVDDNPELSSETVARIRLQ